MEAIEMTFKELKKKIKEEQKKLAQSIKLGKPLRKPSVYNQADGDELTAYRDLYWNRRDYRHNHIAYCQMFNSTPYALIEQPRDNNLPDKTQLFTITKKWEAGIDEETIRDCA